MIIIMHFIKVPIEESPVNSQSSEYSSNSLDTDEAGKII